MNAVPEPLTSQQTEILDFIRSNMRGDRFPTFRAIAAAMGHKSLGGLQHSFQSMERRGYIRRVGYGKWQFVAGVHSPDELLREVHESGCDLPSGLHRKINAYFGVRT